nr:serine/threonine-protein kinase [Acidobacteriota bacterium]
MGEVFRARDTKLDRDVAIKILPEAFAHDADLLARFTREAKTLASLNHPNIAAIYGLEESGGMTALVMELVEGDDLSQRIARGAMPLDEALPIAKQIAEALEAAHEQGIIHRDLKPANIKVRPDGTVKVLDFGLAKAMDPVSTGRTDPPLGALSDSPTMTSPARTQQGLILGTAAYMSPEQAKGRVVDKRADIWAFGCVLFEMLAGQSLFAGDTLSETLASVIKDEPRLDRLPGATPAKLRRILARCLERDPKLRLRDIGEARILLAQPDNVEVPSRPGLASRRVAWIAIAVGVVIAMAVGAIAWRVRPSADSPMRRFELPANIGQTSALSPDGSRVAYVADGHLRVRAFEVLDPSDLGALSQSTSRLFWSPDSRTIGFISEGTIRSIPAGGGPVFSICKIPASGRALGAAWRTDGTIVFSVWRDSLYQVPASGGTPTVYLAIDPEKEIDFHQVEALPDQRVILVTHRHDDAYQHEIFDGKRRLLLVRPGSKIGAFLYAPPGHLLFIRSDANKGLWAMPFSDGPLDLSKASLVDPQATAFDVAADGTLIVTVPPDSASKSELVWVDRTGTSSAVPGAPVETNRAGAALSPDGRRAVFVAGEQGDVFVRDLQSGVDTRLTFEPTPTYKSSVAWLSSGDQILYSSFTNVEDARIIARRADGTGDARSLAAGIAAMVSPDGRFLVFAIDDRGRYRLRYAPILSDGTLGAAQPIFHGGDEPNVSAIDLS